MHNYWIEHKLNLNLNCFCQQYLSKLHWNLFRSRHPPTYFPRLLALLQKSLTRLYHKSIFDSLLQHVWPVHITSVYACHNQDTFMNTYSQDQIRAYIPAHMWSPLYNTLNQNNTGAIIPNASRDQVLFMILICIQLQMFW